MTGKESLERLLKEQALRSLDRVSKGEIWTHAVHTCSWTHVYDAASRAFALHERAAE